MDIHYPAAGIPAAVRVRGAASPPHRRCYQFHQFGIVKGRDRQERTRCDQIVVAEAAANSHRRNAGSGRRRDAGAGILERHRQFGVSSARIIIVALKITGTNSGARIRPVQLNRIAFIPQVSIKSPE
jgi:hypothetical protein